MRSIVLLVSMATNAVEITIIVEDKGREEFSNRMRQIFFSDSKFKSMVG